ncbi:hypothetical protein HK098_006818 [Nowakowskiella sp. JEL0407]|nr:hypothetical protein HK098_006818 [Nowakowskiella sp. JEL0407]
MESKVKVEGSATKKRAKNDLDSDAKKKIKNEPDAKPSPSQPTQVNPAVFFTDVDMSSMNTKVWLVKVPKFVAEAWANVDSDDPDPPELGRVRIVEGPGNTSKYTLHLPKTTWSESLPKTYNLNFTNKNPQNEFIFTEDSTGKCTSIAGIVANEANISPEINKEYSNIMKKRMEDKKKAAKKVALLDDGTENKSLLATYKKDAGGFISRKTKQLEDRKERLPKQELVQLLFTLFQKERAIAFKDLVTKTQQPQIWLREVLNDIAELNKNMYELKPEFQQAPEIVDDDDDEEEFDPDDLPE